MTNVNTGSEAVDMDLELLHIAEGKFAERAAFCFFDADEKQVTVSYGQFYDDIRRAAGWLSGCVQSLRGAHIGLFAQSCYEAVVCLYAVLLSGGVLVPFNIGKSWDEISYEIDKAEAEVFLADEDFLAENPELTARYQDRVLEITGYRKCRPVCMKNEEHTPEQLSMILFTSGTTGRSKGVATSWGTLCINTDAFFDAFLNRKDSDGRFFFCLPLYHAYPINAVMSCLKNGLTVCLWDRRTDFGEAVRDSGCGCGAMVPTHVNLLVKRLKKRGPGVLGKMRLICCAGAPCAPESIALLLRHGVRVVNHFGMTENSAAVINLSDNENVIANSVGRAFGDTKVRILDGEILLRGGSVMLGYYHDPKATAEALQDGWLHTGDMGYLDEDGYLYITGRKKNLIILSGGENVSPEELEERIRKCPAVNEVVVRQKGDHICAEVYCESDMQEQVSADIERMNAALPLYKQVSLVDFRAVPFPKTGSGKIIRG